MNSLASLWLEAKRWAEAEMMARECLDLRKQKQPDDWWRFHTMSQLGVALAGQKKYGEAEPLIIQGYEGLQTRAGKIPLPWKQSLADAAARIVPFYQAWGQHAQAAEWRKKLPPAQAIE
jgi:hypothetical protein